MVPIFTLKSYPEEFHAVDNLAASNVLIADSFLATLLGSVQLVRLSEVRPTDVLVVRTTAKSEAMELVLEWLQLELVKRGSRFHTILLSTETSFNPFKFRGIGWRRALRPIQERRYREREFETYAAQIASISGSRAAQTVWFGASPINSFVNELFPQATKIRVDHGLADILTNGASARFEGIRRPVLRLEKLALRHPYQQPTHDRTLSLLSDEVLDLRSRELTRRLLIHTSRQILSIELRKQLDEGFALLLVPVIVEAKQQKHTSRLASYFADALEGTHCPSLVLIKGHPTGNELSEQGTQEKLASQVHCTLRDRGISNVRVTSLDSQVPVELLLPHQLSLLVGPLSASHLTTRLWNQTARVFEIDWRQEAKETAQAWSPSQSRTQSEASLSAFDDFRSSFSESRSRRSYLEMLAASYALQTTGMQVAMRNHPALDWKRLFSGHG